MSREAIRLTDRKTGKVVYGHKYIQGEHPPCPGVKVTMGKNGVLARANTVHGEHSVIYNNDWLVTIDDKVEIYTDRYVHDFYQKDEEEGGDAKPVVLG